MDQQLLGSINVIRSKDMVEIIKLQRKIDSIKALKEVKKTK